MPQNERMRMMVGRTLIGVLTLVFVAVLESGCAQTPRTNAEAVASATIAAKKPVFAGACKACPWGILAKVTADALSFYGYQTTVCWVCWSTYGPREMGDKTKPVMPPDAEQSNPEYIEPPPDAVPDISATSESNLIDAWNGTGAYAADHKQRRIVHPFPYVVVWRILDYELKVLWDGWVAELLLC